jgi:hypothetical protein
MISLRTLSRTMAVPKDAWTGRRPRAFIPTVDNDDLPFLLGRLAPAERKALQQIVETADLVTVNGKTWLLTPADPGLLDTLATIGTDGEDREGDLCDEPSTGDSNGSHAVGFDEDMEPDDDCGMDGSLSWGRAPGRRTPPVGKPYGDADRRTELSLRNHCKAVHVHDRKRRRY